MIAITTSSSIRVNPRLRDTVLDIIQILSKDSQKDNADEVPESFEKSTEPVDTVSCGNLPHMAEIVHQAAVSG